jgi:glucose dehydrogenase
MRSVSKAATAIASAAATILLVAAIGDSLAAERKIAASPAFKARDLTAAPRDNWITNGGNVFNQRYSPLTLLNRDNVKDLKALWRTSMGSGALPNNSGQAQILHYEALRHQFCERRVHARHGRRDPLTPRQPGFQAAAMALEPWRHDG